MAAQPIPGVNFTPANQIYSEAPKKDTKPNYNLSGGGGVPSGPNQNFTPADANVSLASGGVAKAEIQKPSPLPSPRPVQPLPGYVEPVKDIAVDVGKQSPVSSTPQSSIPTNAKQNQIPKPSNEQFVLATQQQQRDYLSPRSQSRKEFETYKTVETPAGKYIQVSKDRFVAVPTYVNLEGQTVEPTTEFNRQFIQTKEGREAQRISREDLFAKSTEAYRAELIETELRDIYSGRKKPSGSPFEPGGIVFELGGRTLVTGYNRVTEDAGFKDKALKDEAAQIARLSTLQVKGDALGTLAYTVTETPGGNLGGSTLLGGGLTAAGLSIKTAAIGTKAAPLVNAAGKLVIPTLAGAFVVTEGIKYKQLIETSPSDIPKELAKDVVSTAGFIKGASSTAKYLETKTLPDKISIKYDTTGRIITRNEPIEGSVGIKARTSGVVKIEPSPSRLQQLFKKKPAAVEEKFDQALSIKATEESGIVEARFKNKAGKIESIRGVYREKDIASLRSDRGLKEAQSSIALSASEKTNKAAGARLVQSGLGETPKRYQLRASEAYKEVMGVGKKNLKLDQQTPVKATVSGIGKIKLSETKLANPKSYSMEKIEAPKASEDLSKLTEDEVFKRMISAEQDRLVGGESVTTSSTILKAPEVKSVSKIQTLDVNAISKINKELTGRKIAEMYKNIPEEPIARGPRVLPKEQLALSVSPKFLTQIKQDTELGQKSFVSSGTAAQSGTSQFPVLNFPAPPPTTTAQVQITDQDTKQSFLERPSLMFPPVPTFRPTPITPGLGTPFVPRGGGGAPSPLRSGGFGRLPDIRGGAVRKIKLTTGLLSEGFSKALFGKSTFDKGYKGSREIVSQSKELSSRKLTFGKIFGKGGVTARKAFKEKKK